MILMMLIRLIGVLNCFLQMTYRTISSDRFQSLAIIIMILINKGKGAIPLPFTYSSCNSSQSSYSSSRRACFSSS